MLRRVLAGSLASTILLSALVAEAAPPGASRTGASLRAAMVAGSRYASRPALPIVITADRPVDAALLGELARSGFEPDASSPARGRRVAGKVARVDVGRLATAAGVVSVDLDGRAFELPRPLDVTQAMISVDAVHRTAGTAGEFAVGNGVTICDIDSGIDVFHPMFFRADGGFSSFVDVDDNGFLDPGVDAVVIDGVEVTLRRLNGVVIDRYTGLPLFDTDDPTLDLRYDYLYADLDGSGAREFGPDAGFTEATPTYGEPLFVADDVNDDGELEIGERLVALGTSKIKAFRWDGEIYERGEDLIEAPWDPDMQHGNGAASVLVGGQHGLRRLVGMAPGADLLMASERGGGGEFAMTNWCVNQGARVVLHEYAPWVSYHMDGSSNLEELIDETSVEEGVVHVNPAGNLSTSEKWMRRTLDASGTTVVPIAMPDNGAVFVINTMLWLDASRDLSFVLTSPSGQTLPLVPDSMGNVGAIEGKQVFAFREDSARGTAKFDTYIYSEGAQVPVAPGTWTVTVTDPSGGGPIDLIGTVFDEVSGWGLGAHFTEFVTEDYLVGWPGTADRGLGVAAFVGHDFAGAAGESGERAYYSGRGHRIDGYPLMWIAAPDNPIVAGTFDDEELGYLVYGGTSGASPHVAGSAALLIEAEPTLDGEAVKERLRVGAVVDDATGEVPNDDFGWGKLDAYRALYGEAAPGGTAPIVGALDVVVSSFPADVALSVEDAEDAVATLTVEVDVDYDGTPDVDASGATATLRLEDALSLGLHVMKVRATDPTGRAGAALLRVTVVEPPDAEPAPTGGFAPSGGAGCAVARTTEPSAAGLALAALGLAVSRRRRRPRVRT